MDSAIFLALLENIGGVTFYEPAFLYKNL